MRNISCTQINLIYQLLLLHIHNYQHYNNYLEHKKHILIHLYFLSEVITFSNGGVIKIMF